MPTVCIDDSLEMCYHSDDFTVLLIHGVAEHSGAWYAWVPILA